MFFPAHHAILVLHQVIEDKPANHLNIGGNYMTDFFIKMNEDYAQKHFPDHSVFEGTMKTVKRRSVGGLIVFGLFFAAALYGLVWGIGRTLQLMTNGEDDMLSVGLVICGFFGIIVLICLLVLIFLIKGSRQNEAIISQTPPSKVSYLYMRLKSLNGKQWLLTVTF